MIYTIVTSGAMFCACRFILRPCERDRVSSLTCDNTKVSCISCQTPWQFENAVSLSRKDMEANVSFEKEEVANDAHTY